MLQQNHDLKQSCQHQQSVIEALEQEVDMYHQLKMPWEQAETSVLIGKEIIVQQLSEYDRLLSVQVGSLQVTVVVSVLFILLVLWLSRGL